ncbi:dihydrolipoyl dehydrogenase [Aquibacillus albus]|uniref:Dihydrolipoyl dehydrogenase n=1 Tax=Aquibacillus albus TaxID=1168171 RepID=A0ABS2MV01_9BACI|nr:dihydrolipoyl dehydrogenase [Aquibacillus albus]MBM7569724.1 dihydrolipoamide dehydrogenase [Aquibacillus albus]
MAKEYDLVILGGGTGGYVAAIRASQQGLKTAIVERDKLGGTCLHRGCIPSKALLRSAEVYQQSKNAQQFGVTFPDVSVDFTKVQNRKNTIVNQLHNGIKHLIKQGKIDVYQGYGRILGPSIFSPTAGTVSVELPGGEENEMIVPKYVLLATGSKPKALNGVEVDGNYVLSSDEALEMNELPKSMLIVGGGVIGIEWASMLADFDVDVTIVESDEKILPLEDEEISKEMTKMLTKKGVTIYTGTKLLTDSLDKSTGIQIDIENKQEKRTLTADKLLLSIGRSPNTVGIGLENTDIVLNEHGFVETNKYYQTKESNIYAIGDMIGGMQLAHVASKEGLVAVDHILGKHTYPLDANMIPTCIYSKPEVASIGLTEKQAQQQGYQLKTSKFSFSAIGKALIRGETDGFVKIVADKATNDLLGVHMIGPQVTELISEAALAKLLDATPWEWTETIHPHPSLSEIFGEAALGIEGRKIHG